MRESREFFRVDAAVPMFVRPLTKDDAKRCSCHLTEKGFDKTLKNTLIRKINISGAGICFENDMPFTQGDILEMRLMLEDAYLGIIAFCVKVLRVEKLSKNYRIAVSYVDLSENVRELIVAFVFKRERTLIQEKRVGWL
jgi:c-di-GMP-binding flagellar brake protein YcgR